MAFELHQITGRVRTCLGHANAIVVATQDNLFQTYLQARILGIHLDEHPENITIQRHVAHIAQEEQKISRNS
jgi:hypothetical protein